MIDRFWTSIEVLPRVFDVPNLSNDPELDRHTKQKAPTYRHQHTALTWNLYRSLSMFYSMSYYFRSLKELFRNEASVGLLQKVGNSQASKRRLNENKVFGIPKDVRFLWKPERTHEKRNSNRLPAPRDQQTSQKPNRRPYIIAFLKTSITWRLLQDVLFKRQNAVI